MTSFNNIIYKNSGRGLIESFERECPEGGLFVAAENMEPPFGSWAKSRWIHAVSIDESPLLHEWLYRNRDVIPKSIGGEYEGEKQSWWNRNAACWFRKVVALDAAIKSSAMEGVRILVWIDADCRFIGNPLFHEYEGWLGGAGCFYMQGPRRKHPETSIVGYDIENGGMEVVNRLIERYREGVFREDERWDDCWQLMRALDDTKIPSNDLFGGYGKVGRVVEHSALKDFFEHDKGINKRHRASMHKKGSFWS